MKGYLERKESRMKREELKSKLKVMAYNCGCHGDFNKHYS
jgi:hypothetical protein